MPSIPFGESSLRVGILSARKRRVSKRKKEDPRTKLGFSMIPSLRRKILHSPLRPYGKMVRHDELSSEETRLAGVFFLPISSFFQIKG